MWPPVSFSLTCNPLFCIVNLFQSEQRTEGTYRESAMVLSDLKCFIFAVCRHWIPLISGGVITAALIVLEHRLETSLPWPYYYPIFLFFLLYSCFAAWRDENRVRAELAARAEPKLSIHFTGSGQRPECQVLGPWVDKGMLEQCLFRVAVSNDSTTAVTGAQVVLEVVESEKQDEFFPGHALRVMGRHDASPRFELGAGATQWVDLVGYYLYVSVEYFFIPYAELGERTIPSGRHTLVLRADGGGLPSRVRVVVNCPGEGLFEVLEFTAVKQERTTYYVGHN